MDQLRDLGFDDLHSMFSRGSSALSVISKLNTYFTTITNQFSNKSPDLFTIAILLIVLFLSLQLLGMLYRAIVFWVTLVIRVGFYVGLGLLAVWMYTRGPEGALDDLLNLKSHWQGEYQKFSRQQNSYAQGFGAGKQRGFLDSFF